MMRYFIVAFVFLLYSCGCFEHTHIGRDTPRPHLFKKITIVNETDKTYKNNGLYSITPTKNSGTWKLNYLLEKDYKNSSRFQKFNTIGPKQTLNKNEKDNPLEISGEGTCDVNSKEYLFLFSLDGGERKIFFGVYDYGTGERVWGEADSDCKIHFIRWGVHPVWENEDLKITIQKGGKIEFSDPKIKEVRQPKKFKLTLLNRTEEVDLTKLPLTTDCK